MKFNEKYYEKYGRLGGKDTSCFIMGTSLGGNITANIVTKNHMNYAGQILAVPYFGLYDPAVIEKVRPFVEQIAKITPDKLVKIKDFKNAKKHV